MPATKNTAKRPARKALKAELLGKLEETLRTLEAAHADTREAATHAEAKPENDKDTRALEQSYLARGQAMRIWAWRRRPGEVRRGLREGLSDDGAQVGVGRGGAVERGEVTPRRRKERDEATHQRGGRHREGSSLLR